MWRAATATDDDAIVRLCLQLHIEDPGPRPIAVADIRRTLSALRQDPLRGLAVVLELDGAVAGYALLISFWSNEAGGELCTIDELYVDARARNRGHGSALFPSVAALWPRPLVGLSLEVTAKNQRAHRLYESLGFVAGNGLMRRTLPTGAG